MRPADDLHESREGAAVRILAILRSLPRYLCRILLETLGPDHLAPERPGTDRVPCSRSIALPGVSALSPIASSWGLLGWPGLGLASVNLPAAARRSDRDRPYFDHHLFLMDARPRSRRGHDASASEPGAQSAALERAVGPVLEPSPDRMESHGDRDCRSQPGHPGPERGPAVLSNVSRPSIACLDAGSCCLVQSNRMIGTFTTCSSRPGGPCG